MLKKLSDKPPGFKPPIRVVVFEKLELFKQQI